MTTDVPEKGKPKPDLPNLKLGEFKPHVHVNEDAGITEAVFEDCAYVAKPVFDGVYHWIDEMRAVEDGRLVGMQIWATKPPEPSPDTVPEKKTAGERLIDGAKEALEVAKGEQPAAALWHQGHKYVPVSPMPEKGEVGTACSHCGERRNVRCTFADCPMEADIAGARAANLEAKLKAAIAERDTLSARLAEAERVIAPFAAEAEMWVEMGDTRPIYSLPPLDGGGPTVGDLRRARAFLNKEKNDAE